MLQQIGGDRLFYISQAIQQSDRLPLIIVFLTNMLDNLLLTAVVPIIPDYLLNMDKVEWETDNNTFNLNQSDSSNEFMNQSEPSMTEKILLLSVNIMNENSKVGWLLSSKAIVQLIANPFISPLASRFGYSVVLFSGTCVIFISSMGMSIVAQRYPDDKSRSRAMGVAMGGSATGVLVGYPFGGFMYTFVGKMAPFCIIAVLILFDLGKHQNKTTSLLKLLRDPYIAVIAGAIMLTTMAMAVIEPTVPLWIMQTMEVQKWQLGLVFLPDSIGYLIGTNCFGVTARNVGRWLCTVGCMTMISLCLICLPFATQLPQLVLPHLGLGLGLGATDAALMPLLALLVDIRHEAFYGSVYAIAQLAVCLAYSVGPSLAGQLVKSIGFPWLIRGLGILNLLFTPFCLLLRKVSTPDENTIIISGENKEAGKHELDDATNGSFAYGRLHEED
ncbi:synaptic vesicular amine transporter [Patella vulgata]|uniref:synaptic vesicular amine transporter n=1 Tax=Patella vulgata TaxID=6465 RepID=UPI002180121D|nr:synaptic vesicular amine transporter [Patella vulgata]